MNTDALFIEADVLQNAKSGQTVAGDVFFSHRDHDTGRLVSVLSDGLGSGIKANVLATLTASMAGRFTQGGFDLKKAAQIIMRTLPICRERKIRYSTFTIMDASPQGFVRLLEYDNPPFLAFRKGRPVEIEKKALPIAGGREGSKKLLYSEFQAEIGDRLVFFSDGVTQSGMGHHTTPLGWGRNAALCYFRNLLEKNPGISARESAKRLLARALENDMGAAKDDTSCEVIYFRNPRRMMLVSGPPFDPANDAKIARMLRDFPGKKAVAGGTTSLIIGKEWGETATVNLKLAGGKVPPPSEMNGLDLITEGIITLSAATELLERKQNPEDLRTDASTLLAKMLLESDSIEILGGTRINEAHQDPSMPVELEIRRNIIKKLARTLEEDYLKEVRVRFI